MCFMNGSMIEHDGLGITYFSVDILKDMVACWYAWVFKSHVKTRLLLWALAPLQIPTSLCEGPFFYFMQFLFWIWVSIFSYKAPTKGHYDRIWALSVANIRVCFMNGLMIEHDGLGITCFSVDILKDMVACWYAWVLRSSCQN